MNDRSGLSIFDDDSNNGADDATQVFSAVEETSATAAGATAGASSFPVVRRGYDPSAVDRRLHTLAGEKAGLNAGIKEARAKAAKLEKQVSDLRRELSEKEAPSYAGLGGRASEMLRLAEEQADEVLAQAQSQADEIRKRATKDAEALKAGAARDAEDMRIVQLKELDETRSRMVAEAEQQRNMAQAEADDLIASARREA
ncbi:MAG: DivIVA domain-containing protein, partial [Nocardioidaceae bacterium]